MRKKGFWQGLYQNLASPKLTVVIFLVLAAASVVGTLLPQGQDLVHLQRHYGPRAFWFITTFGLHDLYHTGWFRLLLLILCANLIICTVERLPKTLKIFRHHEEDVDPEKLLRCSLNCRFTSAFPRGVTEARLNSIISQGFGDLQRLDTVDHLALVAEKGRWSPFMVYVVHASVLLVLLGALVGSIFGFKGVMNILEGEATNEVMLEDSDKGLSLPFQVRCDRFEVSYYDNGMPREFRSDLTLTQGGQEVLKRELRVNDPLTYEGVTFYQASYGTILKDADVELTDRESGAVRRLKIPFREWTDIPGTKDKVQILRFSPDFQGLGPAIGVLILREGHEPIGSWILMDKEFHGNVVATYRVKVIGSQVAQYTGLQVRRDPGVWLVWLGFAAIIVGIGLIYYVSHRRLWVWAEEDTGSETTTVIIAGRTNRSEISFEQDFKRLCDRLRAELTEEGGSGTK
ncbi:MAG TPA: cytochrome c biogenesis protein ResB [Syntrophales bacterium]|nr:cytochrome c biogenesis protein ResB [Syntrophales bacterium]